MGICRGGKTLRELITEREQLFRETGHVWGLRELELMDKDPIKFDKLQWKLVAAGRAAREASKLISASPAAVGMGELVDMIALPDGDVVAASMGLQAHAGCISLMIKGIAELGYEDDPGTGIKDGDIFTCNDPLYGAAHAADTCTLVPIFHEGSLVAWAAGLNHVADVGGALAAGSAPTSHTAYQEGLVVPPSKTGQNFTQSRWWHQHLIRRTRTGVLNILDDKMRLAGALMLRDQVLEIIGEFGIDYFAQALREMIERERRDIVNRVRTEMVPGRFVQRGFRLLRPEELAAGSVGAKDGAIVHFSNDTTITPQGTIACDFAGCSSEGANNRNAYPGAKAFGLWNAFYTFLVQSPLCNTALQYVVRNSAPEGSFMNPRRTDLGMSLGLAAASNSYTLGAYGLAVSRFARGYIEEAYTWEGAYSLYGTEGVFENGTAWGMSEFSLVGGMPVGASAWRDGFAHTTGPGNAQGDSGETEEWEFVMPPLLTVGRRHVTDFVSHGRYRGANGLSLTHLVTEPGQILTVSIVSSGSAMGGFVSTGIFGGYPTSPNYNAFFHDTNAFELVDKGISLPRDYAEIWEYIDKGTLKVGRVEEVLGDVPFVNLAHGDLMTQAAQANCAWGDPLDRDSKLVEADLNGEVKEDNNVGWMSEAQAKRNYGVVASSNGRWTVDEDATRKERALVRETRRKHSMPVKEWWATERKAIEKRELSPLVQSMYDDCLSYEKFAREFTQFWQLDDTGRKGN